MATVLKEYRAYFASIQASLPSDVVLLDTGHTLHDAKIKRIDSNFREKSAEILLNGWNTRHFRTECATSCCSLANDRPGADTDDAARTAATAVSAVLDVSAQTGGDHIFQCDRVFSASRFRLNFVNSPRSPGRMAITSVVPWRAA